MGTRATIRFTDGDEQYFVYRGHDAYPENVLAHLKATVEKAKGRWSDPELGCLVTLFLAMGYDFKETILPYYELTPCFHGDESYRYFVSWDEFTKQWTYGLSSK